MSKRRVASIRCTAARGVPTAGSKATVDIGVVGSLVYWHWRHHRRRATFGLAVVGARGSTYVSFLLGGILALLTSYSYVRLTLRYTEPGGTIGFVRRAFGRSLLPASINVLLIYSYIAIMAVYAHALAAYSASYIAPGRREFWLLSSHRARSFARRHQFCGRRPDGEIRGFFQYSKLGILFLFIAAGFLLGPPDWRA